MTRINPITWWSAGINLAGALAVGWGIAGFAPRVAPWVLVLAALGLVAWVIRTLVAVLRRADPGSESGTAGDDAGEAGAPAGIRTLAAMLLAVMVLSGSLTAVPTHGTGVAMLAVAVLLVAGDPATPLLVWGAVVLAGALGIAAGALLAEAGIAGPAGEGRDVPGLLIVLAVLLMAMAAGLGRRAQRVLLQERARAGAEALRAQEVASRVGIARDLHDVLAHSLGGLVVQLDAVEALLDAGDVDTAATRVAAARRLAVEGLHEAREAVRTLREPAPVVAMRDSAGAGSAAGAVSKAESAALAGRLQALVAAHEGVGAGAQLRVSGTPRPVSAALAEALSRAVQEGLSNARKHAPGSVVQVGLIWHPDRVECVIENRIRPGVGSSGDGSSGDLFGGSLHDLSGSAAFADELAATGGGYGLRGVRERFAALGGTVQAGVVQAGAVQAGAWDPSTGSGTETPLTGSGTGIPLTGSGTGIPLTGSGTGIPLTGSGAGIPLAGSGAGVFVLRIEVPA